MTDSVHLSTYLLKTVDSDPGIGALKNNRSAEKCISKPKDPEQLRQACNQMEALFLNHLLKEMRNTIPKSGLFSGGKAEEMYTSMLDAHRAKEFASKRGIGLSSILFEQLSKSQDQLQNQDSKQTGKKD
jgi:flagellar protein FlgJ